eukprot:365876-Chlamydomonas_euryale.AAC.6
MEERYTVMHGSACMAPASRRCGCPLAEAEESIMAELWSCYMQRDGQLRLKWMSASDHGRQLP